MIKETPGMIEITDTTKFCDYALVEISLSKWQIRKHQFEEDWEDEHPIEVLEEFQEYSDTKAIAIFMKLVNELLGITREGK